MKNEEQRTTVDGIIYPIVGIYGNWWPVALAVFAQDAVGNKC
jgi:hypothetical protein